MRDLLDLYSDKGQWEAAVGQPLVLKGWIRSVRHMKKFSFLTIHDGTAFHPVQVVADSDVVKDLHLSTGASVSVTGSLVSTGKDKAGQQYEIQASAIQVVGEADSTYPLQKKYHSLEFLREITHLRCRTNTLGASMRIRSAASFAIHEYFQSEGFCHVHTPILTPLDCEGAGELFEVRVPPAPSSTTTKNGDAVKTPTSPSGEEHFFGQPMYLGVSGQLYGELAASSLSKVYTFGPTFRAENSHTSRHLCEFWMIEPEIAHAGTCF